MASTSGLKEATALNLINGTPVSRSPVWSDAVEAFDVVLKRNVDEPNKQLAELRHLRDNFDRDILMKTCRMLGFDITQDVLDLQTDLTKLVTQLPLYSDHNGTYLFQKFIELLLNGECEVDHLWAEIFPDDLDHYYNWSTDAPADKSKWLVNGGNWIQTTHIDLYIGLLYGARDLDTIVLKPGQTLVQRIIEIFFDYAPIALVIRNFWFLVKVNMLIRVGVDIPSEGISAYLKVVMDPPIIIQSGLEPGGRTIDGATVPTIEYVDAKVLDFTGPGTMRAQTDEMDRIAFPLAVLAARSVQEAMEPGSAAVNTAVLPTFAEWPANELTGSLLEARVMTPVGPLAFDWETAVFEVEADESGFSIYAKVNAYVLNPVQWPMQTWITVVTHYSGEGVAAEAPSYFIHKSVATMFSNFRVKTNGLIFSSLEHV